MLVVLRQAGVRFLIEPQVIEAEFGTRRIAFFETPDGLRTEVMEILEDRASLVFWRWVEAQSRRDPARLSKLAQAEALLVARARGWEAAAPLFTRIAEPPARLSGPPATALLRLPPPGPAIRLAVPMRDRPSFLPEAEADHLVVYTAAFGRPAALRPVLGISARVRFLCFTDQALAAPGWTVLPAADSGGDPLAATAFHDALSGTHNPEVCIPR